jgi:hypothetical protein
VEPDNLFKPSNPVADKHAQLQDGLLVYRVVTLPSGKEVGKWGQVHVRDLKLRPLYFEIRYDDGTTDIVDPRGLRALKPFARGWVRPAREAGPTDPPL